MSEQLSRALLERYRPCLSTSRLLKDLAIRANNRGKTVLLQSVSTALLNMYRKECNNSESLIMCSISACGLQCYKCLSTKSWDDCESAKEVVNCSSSDNRCFKAYVNIKDDGKSVEGYNKGCDSADDCKTATDTEACKKGTCKIDCCSGDLCNAGTIPLGNAATVPLVSAIILSACAVLTTSLKALIIFK